MLQEEALIIVSNLGINNFKASNGWLQRFKDRNNIKQLVVSGESGDVNEETVAAWRERLIKTIPWRMKLVVSFEHCPTNPWPMQKKPDKR